MKVDLADILPDFPKNPEGLVIRDAIWNELKAAVNDLSRSQNEVFIWHEFEGMSFREMSELTVKTENALRLRDVTAPSAYANTIVVGDFEGYLHWIDPRDGSFLARERVSTRPISAAPLVVGANLFAQAEDGTVAAYTVLIEEPESEPADDPA